MPEMPPAIPFGHCAECCAPLTLEETVHVGRCSDCLTDEDLARKRPKLYAALGLIE